MWNYFSNLWERQKVHCKLHHLLLDELGKVLVGVGLGCLLAPWIKDAAWILIGVGIAISLLAKLTILKKR